MGLDREKLTRTDKADLKREARHRTSGPATQKTPTNQNPVIGRLVDEGKVPNRDHDVPAPEDQGS